MNIETKVEAQLQTKKLSKADRKMVGYILRECRVPNVAQLNAWQRHSLIVSLARKKVYHREFLSESTTGALARLAIETFKKEFLKAYKTSKDLIVAYTSIDPAFGKIARGLSPSEKKTLMQHLNNKLHLEHSTLSENLERIRSQVSKTVLIESTIAQVDWPTELLNSVDAGNLPQFIVVGDGPTATTYTLAGASSPDLHKLMSAAKGPIGKVVYSRQGAEDQDAPPRIELHIYKSVAQRKTVLSVGQIITQ